jgi:hypothetical protein
MCVLQGFTWLTPSPAAEQAAAPAPAHSSCTLPSRLPPVYGCHATNASAQLDLDAASQTLAAVPAADACLVQLRDDGLGRAVRAFGRAAPRPVAEHRLLEANLYGILQPVMIIRCGGWGQGSMQASKCVMDCNVSARWRVCRTAHAEVSRHSVHCLCCPAVCMCGLDYVTMCCSNANAQVQRLPAALAYLVNKGHEFQRLYVWCVASSHSLCVWPLPLQCLPDHHTLAH